MVVALEAITTGMGNAHPSITLDGSGNPLSDVSGEIERFLASLPPSALDWARVQERSEDPVDLARNRARIRNLPPLTAIDVVTRDGRTIHGELVEANEQEFKIWVRVQSGSGKKSMDLRYDEIDSVTLPEWNGWMPDDRVDRIQSGKRIEVLLVDQTKVKGRLRSATTAVLTLEQQKGETRELSRNEIACVRVLGMPGATKAALIAGAAVGGAFLLSWIALATYSP
jgi:small nuclear ribonucleoprotein (snRNP)-like protein